MKFFPALNEFCQLAKIHNLVPVVTKVATDMETPVSLYYKLVAGAEGYILESADSSKSFGRYSIIGLQPFAHLSLYRDYTEVRAETETEIINGDPLTVLPEFMSRFSLPDLPGLPAFSGGAVGYLTYEAVATWERVIGKIVPAGLVLGEFYFCRCLIIMDHLTNSTSFLTLVPIRPEDSPERKYAAAQTQLVELVGKLKTTVFAPPAAEFRADEADNQEISGPDRALYEHLVEQAKEYIAAGDIYQVVLSQAFTGRLNQSPFTIYRRLRRANPSPYMFYLNFGRRKLVGASPEMMVKLDNGRVLTCPIAGTRPRGRTEEQDARYAEELMADPKERAEHAMLVDLGRNDIGRVSLPGTVAVTRLMQIEKFSHVMHIVSEVSGRIKPGLAAVDVLKACFPAGTLSGAPKIRAMEIINELEQCDRGPYAGAVGYLDFRGNMDTCITIRTLAVEDGKVFFRTGAGIVADSVPANEYQEVLNKAGILLEVLKGGGADDIADR